MFIPIPNATTNNETALLSGHAFHTMAPSQGTFTQDNVAFYMPTTQSSELRGGRSLRAVDGNRAVGWDTGSCTHTAEESNPWWRIDLEAEASIEKVRIWNRDHYGDRLHEFEIKIGNVDNWDGANEKCGDRHSVPQAQSLSVNCRMRGRYVFIIVPGDVKVISYSTRTPIPKRTT